jgi:iron complex transport system substrate-binding protein
MIRPMAHYPKTLTQTLKLILTLILPLLIAACSGCDKPSAFQTHPLPVDYARGFRLDSIEGGVVVSISFPEDTLEFITRLALMEEGHRAPAGMLALQLPLQRIICLSSTYMGYFLELDATANIVAVNSFRHLNDSSILDRVEKGEIRQVGKEGHFNTELIAALDPDVIFVSPFKAGGYDALMHLGFPLVPVTAYEEEVPLARAEWIKLIGCFTGQYPLADSLFQNIATEYQRLCALADQAKHRPTVFSGRLKSNMWYVPGGKSYYAHYFKDAGAHYLFGDNEDCGALQIDFEVVYQKAAEADFWRMYSNVPGKFTTRQLADSDHRYTLFKPFDTGNILYCNIHEKPYYEKGPVQPHLILADYISLFHPELLPGHAGRFYEMIDKNHDE